MLQTVDVGKRSINAYRGVAPDAVLEDLLHVAESLRGSRIVQINATPYGGGVSELLRSAVPLLNDLGIIADWKVISGDNAFFEITKKIHNGLQGAQTGLTEEEREIYTRNTERNARFFEENYDLVVIHDPQPAGMLSSSAQSSAAPGSVSNPSVIWVCGVEKLSAPSALPTVPLSLLIEKFGCGLLSNVL